nr:DUF2267 domain-containing protein [Sciscionella marina]
MPAAEYIQYGRRGFPVRYDEIVDRVRAGGGPVNKVEAEALVQSVAAVLGQRLTGAQAGRLADHLPEELRRSLIEADQGQRFGAVEFLGRVAQREAMGRTGEQLRVHVRAVFGVLAEAVSTGEFEEVLDQLPADYEQLVSVAG